MTHPLAIGEIEPQRVSSVTEPWPGYTTTPPHPTSMHAHVRTHAHALVRTDQGKREGKEEKRGLTGLKIGKGTYRIPVPVIW